jgi:hypothetical protein
MEYTFHIEDSSNPKVKAFLEYIRTLDFVKEDKIENQEFVLTEEHLEILNERRKDRLEGKSQTHSWEEVKDFARNRHSK